MMDLVICDFNLKKPMTAALGAEQSAECRICQDFLPQDLQFCPHRISLRISQFSTWKDFLVLKEKILLPWIGWRWWSQHTPVPNILSPTKQKETIKTRQINHPGKAGDLSNVKKWRKLNCFISISFSIHSIIMLQRMH